jgi:hypothetical protein
MSDITKPGDLADKAADGAFGGVTSHRAGYGDKLARVEDWLRRHPTATLASGEGWARWALVEEIDRLRAELLREHMRLAACGVVAMANTPDTATKARNILPEYRSASCDDVARVVDENMKLRAAIDRVRALHAPVSKKVGWGTLVLCAKCLDEDNDPCIHPCPTLRALDGEDA